MLRISGASILRGWCLESFFCWFGMCGRKEKVRACYWITIPPHHEMVFLTMDWAPSPSHNMSAYADNEELEACISEDTPILIHARPKAVAGAPF